MIPANDTLEENAKAFRLRFITNKKTIQFFNMLEKQVLLNCDDITKSAIYLEVIKLYKFILLTTCFTLAMGSQEPTTAGKKESPQGIFIQNGLGNGFGDGSNKVCTFVDDFFKINSISFYYFACDVMPQLLSKIGYIL